MISTLSLSPANRLSPPLRLLPQSLLARLGLVVVAMVIVTSALLFVGIEHFISQHFERLRDERLARFAEQVRATTEEELSRLHGIARLLVNDSDLRNSTYYHLYLAGERTHPQGAIDRAAAAFGLTRIALWRTDGGLVASHGPAPALIGPPAAAGSRLIGSDGDAWLTAQVPLVRDEITLGWLQLVEPLNALLERRFGAGGGADVAVSHWTAPIHGALRLPLSSEGNVSLDVQITDTAGEALAAVKALLSKVLILSAIVMALVFVGFLRWQLRPLMGLHQAAQAVGRGDFTIQMAPRGSREIATLIGTFNRMTEDLARLREVEQRLQHEERLSAIGRVAARVAHNINNPLTVIHNVARLMQTETCTPESADDLKTILHQSSRAMHTVEQLLHYGRPLRPCRQALTLGRLCQDICTRWQNQAECEVEYLALTDPQVEVDPLQIEELLENLLDNACQAAPGGPIQVEVTEADGRARVRVHDQGPGFPSEVMAHLFEPFFTTKSAGSGLGLAGAQAIARAHGGDIRVGDGPGGDIEWWLPLANTPASA